LQDVEFDDVVVYTHRMENVQKMKFRQYWRPVEDDLCEGMTVLQPAELVFVGFEK
jgi:CRISPR type III-associated protein (TIGR04423 family)